MNNKLKVIFAILGAVGGLFSIASEVGSLFVKDDEPQCPLLISHDSEEK